MFLHAVDLIKLPQFKDLPIEIVLAFFDSSEVRAKEIELFTAAVEWYQHQHLDEDNTDACNSLFHLIRYPLISKDDLLDKVRPIQEKDLALYTAALEYHIDDQRYAGPPQQTTQRKPWFEIISINPDTVVLEKTKTGTLISRVGADGWNGLCAIRVGPQEQTLQFLISSDAPYYIYRELKSASIESLSCELDNDDLSDLCDYEEIEQGITTVKAYASEYRSKPIFKLKFGTEILYASVKKETPIFFCIYMHDAGDQIRISPL